MSRFKLQLLGTVRVESDEDNIPRFRSQRTMALLGYLAVEKRAISRDYLAALFWPDEEPAKGKANLRRELHNLAQILPGCWQTSRVEVAFVPREGTLALSEAEVAVDIYQFRQYEAAQQWQEATDLIGGNFLEGIVLADNLEFETWLLGEQERWRQRATHILQRSVDELEKQGAYQNALRYARRLLQLMPWREETHCQVMQLLALIGRRSEALKQFEECQRVLQAELGVAVSDETFSLQQRIKMNTNFRLHNLTLEITPFIGRRQELEQIINWLSDPAMRLITIAGAGGMGKTRLALAVAEQFIDSNRMRPQTPFSHGVYFVNLAPLSNPDQIVSAIAIAIEFKLQSGSKDSPRHQLLNYLQRKQMLLILDNFEHLLTGATIVKDILAAALAVKIVVTSRERLRIKGEQLISLDGLRFILSHQAEAGNELLENEAARLFLETARRNSPHLNPTIVDNNHINRICYLVEGMPLALELAAMWVDSMSLPDIEAELEQNLHFLESEAPDLPLRHRSMHALFASSWKQLSSGDQMILASLSVFQGGFTLDAAKYVAGTSNKTLSLLVNRSLLRFDQAIGRYNFHELLRQFAALHLQENPELAITVRQQHLAYFCQLAVESEQHLRGGDQIGWTNRLLQERNNIRSAIDWGMVHNLKTAVQMATHLYLFWFSTGLLQEGEKQYLKLLPRQKELPENLQAWLLTGYVAVTWLQGKMDEIKQFSEEAISLFQNTNDTTGLAMSYFHLSVLDGFLGETESALKNIDLAIEYARKNLQDTWALTLCLESKADFLLRIGAFNLAREIANESYRLSRQRGDNTAMTYIQLVLARLALIQGEPKEAKRLCLSNLPIAQDLRHRRLEVFTYLELGQIALAEELPSEAISHLNVAAQMAQDSNQWDALNKIFFGLGDAYLALNEYKTSAVFYRRSVALCQELEHSEYMAICLEKLAWLHWQQGSKELKLVQWLATAISWREEANILLFPTDLASHEQLLIQMKKQFPKQEFDRAWQQGSSQSLAEALATADL